MERSVHHERHTGSTVSFFSKVRKHFGYLINDHDFAVVHQEDIQSFDNCLIVLQSSNCRIRVVRDRGTVLVEAGPLSAPSVHRPPGSPNLWFSLSTIITYLEQDFNADKDWFYASPKESIDDDEAKIDWELALAADTLRPYLDDIMHLFQESTFGQKQGKLEEFRERRKEVTWQRVMSSATRENGKVFPEDLELHPRTSKVKPPS